MFAELHRTTGAASDRARVVACVDNLASQAIARDLAIRAGHGLVSVTERVGPHMRWSMSASYRREMPNFSRGTAGIAYSLARLFWNNHGQCCGTAGVADFFLHLRAERGFGAGFEARLDGLFTALEAAGEASAGPAPRRGSPQRIMLPDSPYPRYPR